MSLRRPIRPYHFQADLIWWDSPFNSPSPPRHCPGTCYRYQKMSPLISSVARCTMKAELNGRRGHAEAAVCEGLLSPDDSAGKNRHTTWVQLTPRHFPALVGLLRASWRNIRSALPQATGQVWFMKRAEATSALTPPVVILCACTHRAVGVPRGENGKKAGGGPGLLEGKQRQQQQRWQQQWQQHQRQQQN